MKIKFILTKILHNWSNNLDQNILKELGYYDILWYDYGNKSIISDHETIIQKLSTIYSNLIENGLGNSHLSRLVNNKIKEIEKELEKLKNQSILNFDSDQLFQNALERAKREQIEHEKAKQEYLNEILIHFLKNFQLFAFNKDNSFSVNVSFNSSVADQEILEYFNEKIDFLKKCKVGVKCVLIRQIFHIDNNYTKITVEY